MLDEKNDHHSLDRRLPHSLFLIVKRNRDENMWQFPQGKLREGENLRMVQFFFHPFIKTNSFNLTVKLRSGCRTSHR